MQEPSGVQPSRRINGAFGQFKISVDNAPVPRSRLYFNFNYYNMSGSSNGGTFDPGPNVRVNIPGAEGGPSGVSIGGNPLNRVVNILFNNDVESFGGSAGIRIPLNAPGTGTTIEGIVGLGGGRLNSDQTFSGEVPGFGRVFAYDSSANVNNAVLDLGVAVTQVVSVGPSGVIVFQGEATVSPTYLSADGRDNFFFTGIPSSTAELDKSKADVGFAFNGVQLRSARQHGDRQHDQRSFDFREGRL